LPLPSSADARRWVIGGRIQGVGFRPFVCTLANELGVSGSVRNQGGQVEIVARSDAPLAALFLRRMMSEHPPIARPELVSSETCAIPQQPGFRILPSRGGTQAVLLPDQSVCAPCLAEMADPNARRYRYPFIACTQCGPRYTIIQDMPFDRANTGMAGFPLCNPCRAEYEQPSDRRFHAQVMACADCGPRLFYRSDRHSDRGNEAALARTVTALHEGAIVAVKGIGGYHLLCDAGNTVAVHRLRARKHRPGKPLAVLFPRAGADGLGVLRRYCKPNVEEARSLCGPERPIVMVTRRDGKGLSPALAPGLMELGALLPYSPLHDLIAGDFGTPLVATSGNVSGEPMLTEQGDAEHRLGSIADAFLHHDRPILHPADDGVVRVIAGRARSLRLGRGSAPLQLALPCDLDHPMLALGGQMKATLALGFGSRAVISPHLGDLDSPRGLDLLEATAETLQRLHGVRADTLICDAHGGYTGTRWALAQPRMTVLRVPHHHAHAAAIAGEFPHEPRWLCFAWDGVGLGEDGTLWGGEALLGRPGDWMRVATFRPFAPPGGEKAAREPWRAAAALAWELGLDWAPVGIDAALAQAAWRQRLNCPPTSSVGRLFDAAAAFLRLVEHASYEGEGPMAVEAIAAGDRDGSVALPLQHRADGMVLVDWAPLVPLLLDAANSPARRAAAFHASMARTLLDQAVALRQIHGPFVVGLTGGVFQNRLLSEQALPALKGAAFRAYLPQAVPCNDAGLSFGQLVEAAAQSRDRRDRGG
jgi:hydrogenase maturation protein HypF